jgi:hypothetical protein
VQASLVPGCCTFDMCLKSLTGWCKVNNVCWMNNCSQCGTVDRGMLAGRKQVQQAGKSSVVVIFMHVVPSLRQVQTMFVCTQTSLSQTYKCAEYSQQQRPSQLCLQPGAQ